MKKRILTIVVALLVMVPSAFAQDYDFSAVAPSGHTLYYKIVDGNAQVTHQRPAIPMYGNLSGALIIPESVVYEGTTYRVTSIGTESFDGCSDMTSVVIPNSVTSIGSIAFNSCRGLMSVTIGSSVTSIDAYAFCGCDFLTSIDCMAEVPPTLGYDVFCYVPRDIPFYVPCGKVAAYQAADGWSNFTNIQEIAGCTSAGAPNVAIYAEGNDVVVEGADGNTVTLYNNAGNLLTTSTASSGTPLRFEGLTSGTYYVKIGVLPARMKVEVR